MEFSHFLSSYYPDPAYDYYKRFYNVRERNPAVVTRGCLEPLPLRQTIEELDANLIICPPAEMVDRLAPYHEVGIDEFILSSNLGQPQAEHVEAMERFAAQVMPHFAGGTGGRRAGDGRLTSPAARLRRGATPAASGR